MFKRFFVAIATLLLTMGLAFAQVDVNKASQAELDGIKGIGPKISKTIIDERARGGSFKDWSDLETRVKGIGEKNSAKMSQAGLTVNGQSKTGAPAKEVKKAEKAAAKPAKQEKKADASAAKASKPEKKADASAAKASKPEKKAKEPKKEKASKAAKASDKDAKKEKASKKDKKAKADKKAASAPASASASAPAAAPASASAPAKK